ncbi:hypothetical protein [Nocardia sp. NPDC057440]
MSESGCLAESAQEGGYRTLIAGGTSGAEFADAVPASVLGKPPSTP